MRAILLNSFKLKYGHQLALENQPNDTTLALVVEMHSRRAVDFISLAKVGSASDTHSVGVEPLRLKETPFLIHPKSLNLGDDPRKRKNDYLTSTDSFVRAVRVLMYAYVLASARDAAGLEWCNLTAAHLHVATVEHFTRLDSRAGRALRKRLLECEMSIRIVWTRFQQAQPELSLTEITHIVGQRRSVWHMEMEFRPPPPSNPPPAHYDYGRGPNGKDVILRNVTFFFIWHFPSSPT